MKQQQAQIAKIYGDGTLTNAENSIRATEIVEGTEVWYTVECAHVDGDDEYPVAGMTLSEAQFIELREALRNFDIASARRQRDEASARRQNEDKAANAFHRSLDKWVAEQIAAAKMVPVEELADCVAVVGRDRQGESYVGLFTVHHDEISIKDVWRSDLDRKRALKPGSKTKAIRRFTRELPELPAHYGSTNWSERKSTGGLRRAFDLMGWTS